jgi:macrophage erythroblast attacher
MLRYQQYIELVRTQEVPKLLEAIAHAKKFLTPYQDTYPREVNQAAGLLAFPPGAGAGPYAGEPPQDRPYSALYSPDRWQMLADLFTETHNNLLALPSFPLLHIALSSGLSALKTPACHSRHAGGAHPGQTGPSSLSASVCPICSIELNELARNVPYAHHSKSLVEHDLMLLPNDHVYGKERLEEHAKKAGLPPGQVKDLVTGDIYPWDTLKKVYIT